MGKLLEKYTKPETTVELQLPLSGDKLKFTRPSIGEITEFADESEKTLQDDLASLEAPDRAAILPFYFEMLGINREEIWKSISQNLETTTKN